MRHLEGSWPAVIWVTLALVLALAVTGLASSAYRRERSHLGELHFRAGEALAQAHQDAGAVDQYRKALLFSPDDPRYRLSLATALIHDQRLDEAQTYLEQLQDEDPNNPLIYLDLARAALSRKKVNSAIQDYQHAVYQYWPKELIPVRRQARWQLVQLLDASGRGSEATGELLQLYASAPSDPAEKDRIGFALLQNGATSEANRIFTELVRQYPHDAGAERGLARARFASGDYVSARHLFQRALRADPHDADSQQGLALTNAVIDLDGSLEGISDSERIRRNESLLRRVSSDVLPCASTSPARSGLLHDIAAAERLLNGKHAQNEDIGFEYQQLAQQLWKERAAACGKNAAVDPAVDSVLARAGE